MKLAPALLSLALATLPAAAQTVVHPTGDPGQDVPAVRAAVEAGGTVLLKAVDAAGQPRAFDFGDFPVGAVNWNEAGSGYVALGTAGDLVVLPVGEAVFLLSVGNDVHLIGETVGEAKTTVRGGTIPIRNLGPLFPGSQVIVFGLGSFTVEGIRFTGSALQPVYLTHLAGIPEVRAVAEQLDLDLSITIRGNEFLDAQPALAGPLWLAQGALADGPAGPTRIENNLVRFTPGMYAAEQRAYEVQHSTGFRADFSEGLAITDLHAPGELIGNRVEQVDVGLHVWLGGAEAVRIADNWVEARPEAFYGLAVEANHTYMIERNTVITPGSFPDGISLWATDSTVGINHSTIRHNHIVMDGSNFGAITLYTGGNANVFSQNVVEGSAAYALGLASPFLPALFPATDNVFRGNRLQRFTPVDSVFWGPGAHILFDENASDNVLVGRSGIVKDLGQNNSATGPRSRDSARRRALQAKLAAKRDLRPARPAPVEEALEQAAVSPRRRSIALAPR